MKTAIIVTPEFESVWPFAADRFHELLTDASLSRMPTGSSMTACDIVSDASRVERLIALGYALTATDLDSFPVLQEVTLNGSYHDPSGLDEALAGRGIRRISHGSEGFWRQSVAEFALGLTISALRGIPQAHRSMITDPDAWSYQAEQFSDDLRFTGGTIEGKRIRIVGAGNIASRYAAFVHALGADVAAWDPYASEPSFHRAGARRERFLDRLITDAEIFVPMVPLTPHTEGLVTAQHIRALPNGCLVVQATRAKIVDTDELRRRVVADELSLAADVFDIEPLAFDDQLLGRSNVVHTPHLAGRTKESNHRWAEMLIEQFAE